MNKALETLKLRLAEQKIDVSTFERLEALSDPIATLRIKGGAPAIKTWKALRALVPVTWHWPVLLGDPEELSFFEDADNGKTSALLAAAQKLKPDPEAWMAESLAEGDDDGDDDGDDGDEDDDDDAEPEGEDVEWPAGARTESFTIPFQILSGKPHKNLVLALVPTRAPWEVPIYLRFGNWNDCPSPERHASLMKRWNEEYGAEVVGITHDVVEMSVLRPPKTRAAARKLAREQCAYCSDIVYQGVGSVEALAATVFRAPSWYFWWD